MGRDSTSTRHWARSARAVALCLLAGLVAMGCGGSADDANADGVVTLGFMTARDQTGVDKELFRRCEKQAGNTFRIEPIIVGPTVDQMREQMARRLAAGDSSIDMLNLDVIWTAEYSDAGWIMDLTERVKPIKDRYVPAALDSTFYKDRYWALPVGTNAALLYYRTDIIKTPPKTWEDLASAAKQALADHPDMVGLVFQGKSYEGGMVNALEFMSSAGTNVLSEDGGKALIDKGDGTAYAFGFVHSMIEDGVAPRVVTTYMEEDARLAFQKGEAVFMRNWPYAAPLMEKDPSSKVKGKFALAPLPGFEGRTRATILGGRNFGVAGTSKHPELAYEAIACLSDEYSQLRKAEVNGEMPALAGLYDDPRMLEFAPFLDVVKDGLEVGQNRPKTPYYNDVTITIYQAFNDVLNGRIDGDAATETMQQKVQAAIDGEAEI